MATAPDIDLSAHGKSVDFLAIPVNSMKWRHEQVRALTSGDVCGGMTKGLRSERQPGGSVRRDRTEMEAEMQEHDIQAFWNRNPVGETLVPEACPYDENALAFFDAYDRYRYAKEGHILDMLDRLDLGGKNVLEIGLGQGADSEQLIRRGADWTGLDLTPESVRRVETRLALKSLPYRQVVCGSAVTPPFEDQCFDLIYSFGVLHHIPDIRAVSKQLHRILRPDGRLVVMLYARHSLNYYLSIALIRRLGLLAALCWPFGGLTPIVDQHCKTARHEGISRYLRMSRFLHANTDGPLNPYSKVYDISTAQSDFAEFELESAEQAFLHAPPLPVRYLPFKQSLARICGWHLWLTFKPKGRG